jgi:hypothetical protein
MQFSALLNSVNIRYLNYYFSKKPVVIQFTTFCSDEDFQSAKKDMEKLLNGFKVVKTPEKSHK